jgi:transposase-like protein
MESVEKIGCNTLVRIELDGTRVYKDKMRYNTLDEAIEACKELNALPHRINKIVSYKCKHCCKYHTGRNGKSITDKYRGKLQAEQYQPTLEEFEKIKTRIRANDIEHANFKVVGKIDLSKIPKK